MSAADLAAVKLSPRQEAALLTLDDHEIPIGGGALAERMGVYGRQWSAAAAHQAASALCGKGLAVKGHPEGATHIRYEITGEGRELAARVRAAR